MKRKKQGAAILLAGIMMSSSTIVWANSYQDTQGHWAEKAITTWSDRSVLNGYNGLFRPNDTITRGEMAVILDRIMYYTEKQQNTFADLDQSFYTDSILKAAKAGTLVGADGFVRPKECITRQEAIVMLAKALSIAPEEGNTKFTDDANIADWSKGYVLAMGKRGYISAEGTFRPEEAISRAEVATLLDNSIESIVTEDITDYTGKGKDVIMNTADRTLQNSVIEGDLILAEGIGEGDVTLDNVTVKGSLIVKGGGIHSVKIKNSNIANVSVQKKSSPVRVVAEQGTTIAKTNVTTSSILEGNFNAVSVSSPVDVTVRGNVESMEVSAKANLQSESGTIKAVNITENGAGSIVKGAGSVQNVTVGAENVSVETTNTNVTVSQNVSKATVNGKTTAGGTESKSSSSSSSSSSNRRPSSSSGGGSSSSGGSSSGGSSSGGSSSGGSSSGGSSSGGSSSGGSSSGGSSSGSDTNQVSDIQIRNVESVSNSLVRVTLSKKTKEPLTLKDFSIICTGGGSNMTIMNVRTKDNRTYDLTTAYYKDNTYNLQVTINGKYANKDFVVKYDCAELTSQEIKRTGETTADFYYVTDAPGTFYYAVAKDSSPVLAAYDNAESGISVNSVLPEGTQPTAEQLSSSGTASNMKLGLNTVKITGLQKDTAYTFYYMAVDVDGRMTPVRQMTIGAKAPEKPKPKPPVKPSEPTNPDDPNQPSGPSDSTEMSIVDVVPHFNEKGGLDDELYWYTVTFSQPVTEELNIENFTLICPSNGNLHLGRVQKINEKTYDVYMERRYIPLEPNTLDMQVKLGDETLTKKFHFDVSPPEVDRMNVQIERTTDKEHINIIFKSNKEGWLYYQLYDGSKYGLDEGGNNIKSIDPSEVYAADQKVEIHYGTNILKNVPAVDGQRFCYVTEMTSGQRAGYLRYMAETVDAYEVEKEPEDPDALQIRSIKVTNGKKLYITFSKMVLVSSDYGVGANNIEFSTLKGRPLLSVQGDENGNYEFSEELSDFVYETIYVQIMNGTLAEGNNTVTIKVANEKYPITFDFVLDANGNTVNETTPAMLSMAPVALSLEDESDQSDTIIDSTDVNSNDSIENTENNAEDTTKDTEQKDNDAEQSDSTENTDSADITDSDVIENAEGDEEKTAENTEQKDNDTEQSDDTENTDDTEQNDTESEQNTEKE